MQRHIFDFRFRPQTGNRPFFENRKFLSLKPEVENMLNEKRIQFCSVSHILFFRYFDQGRRQGLLKIFAPYVIVYGHTRPKMILAATRIEESKNEDMTLITKLMSFPIDTFRLPITMIGTSGFRKTVYFRFEIGNGSRKVDVAESGVNCIYPQSFIQIGPQVSE